MKDRLQSLLSRKFLAFAVATILLATGLINQQTWVIITGAYIGLNVAQNILVK
jgi:hypothetical protein